MRISREDGFGKVERTPQGGLRIGANFSRIGIFEYRMPDGSTRRELRHPEDVFDAASLATLRGASVVLGHPDVITTENWQTFTVGFVGDDVAADGKFVSGTVRIQEAGAVDDVLGKSVSELSCGYSCDFDPTPGTWDGQPYDGRQKNIKYNHVGLGPRNWGRAGNDVRLKLDGGHHPRSMDLEKENEQLRSQIKADAAESARLAGKLAASEAKVSELESALKKAESQDRIDALVAARAAVCDSARNVLGDEYVFAGKSDVDIMKDAVAKTYPALKLDGMSADYIRGSFEALGAKPHPSLAATRADAVDATKDEGDTVEAARKRSEQRGRDAWKGKKS